MHVRTRFPVFVEEALIPGHRTPKPVLHLVQTVVEIAVATGENLPVA